MLKSILIQIHIFFLFFNVKRMVNKVRIETLIFLLILKLKFNE